ncbi:MAG: hypothetical protein NZ522_02830, partial [Chitinophagales bacterium]|nr:hypothetical protein [Chitinophagales bacterium]
LIIVAFGTLVSYLMLTSVAVPRIFVAMLPSVIFLYTTYKVSKITLAASYDSLLKYNALGAFALSVCIAIALNL